jgi:hypothetical protein
MSKKPTKKKSQKPRVRNSKPPKPLEVKNLKVTPELLAPSTVSLIKDTHPVEELN